ncbi:MAG: hypothetical protein QXZ09_07515 [Candidatus Methanomethylicaceae archaeon]
MTLALVAVQLVCLLATLYLLKDANARLKHLLRTMDDLKATAESQILPVKRIEPKAVHPDGQRQPKDIDVALEDVVSDHI